jgi:hypothetical protein
MRKDLWWDMLKWLLSKGWNGSYDGHGLMQGLWMFLPFLLKALSTRFFSQL